MQLTDKQQEHRAMVDKAFDRAISDGRLSGCKSDPNYAGDYMYMGNVAGRDLFKHWMTRAYIQ